MNTNRLEVVGEILVPKSSIHLPIGLGVANTTLALAAGTMRQDQKMGKGNYPLAGHHMVNRHVLFGPLYFKTKVGDNIYLTDLKKSIPLPGLSTSFHCCYQGRCGQTD